MAVAIPVVIAWAGVAGGAAVAGMTIAAYAATAAGFMMTAGAVLTTVGAVTKKQDLMKIGGFLQLGGGALQAYQGYTAAQAAKAATQESANAAWAAGGQAEVAAGAAARDAALTAASPEASGMIADLTTQQAASSAFTAPSISQSVADAASQAVTADIPTAGTNIAPRVQEPLSVAPDPATSYRSTGVNLDPVAGGAQQMPQSEFVSLLKAAAEKTGKALNGVGAFVKANPELVKIGGSMLESMYGPEAEAFDFKKSIYNRQLNNLNNPIKLGVLGGRG